MGIVGSVNSSKFQRPVGGVLSRTYSFRREITDSGAVPWNSRPKMDGNETSMATASAHTFGVYGRASHLQNRILRSTARVYCSL